LTPSISSWAKVTIIHYYYYIQLVVSIVKIEW
jgi:hypothetical protein